MAAIYRTIHREQSSTHAALLDHPAFVLEISCFLGFLLLADDGQLTFNDGPSENVPFASSPTPEHTPEDDVSDEDAHDDETAGLVTVGNGTVDTLDLKAA
jgi:hypothetical protein